MRTAAFGPLIVWALVVFIAAEEKDAPSGPAFSCRGRSPGYYADLETDCQDYHMCDAGGRRYTYSCPNQTRFQQRVMICDHWFLVDCSLSESHFDANLLIGQKDKHFVDQFQQHDSYNEDSFYRRISTPAPKRNFTQPQATKESKKSFLTSATKKETSNKYAEIKFTTPNAAIKPTTERNLPREFVNNPFFSGLTQTPSSTARKGDRSSLTSQQEKDQAVSQKPRPTSAPLLVTPPARVITPPLRNQPPLPSYEPRRSSTAPTTALPSTFDYGFVTREGRPSHLTQRTEPPRLFRNDFSKVIEITSFGAYTTERPASTERESAGTRERANVRAPLPLTRAPPTPALASPVWAPPSPTTNPNRTQSSSYEVGFLPFNGTQGSAGLLRTPGGFRYVAKDAVLPERGPTGFGRADFSSRVRFTSGPDVTQRETYSTGFDRTTERVKPTATGSGTGTGFGFPSGPSASTGTGSTTRTSFSAGKGFPSGVGTSTGGEFPSGFGSVAPSGPGSVGDIPTGPDSSLESRFPDVRFEEHGSSPGEEEEDLNTVEVRIPDPRRMFFIPEDAASEAEMLSSTNETVLRIPLPSSRHHGAMRFKGVRGAKGRHPDCPQCHPAFLVPGTCQPCVLIRR